MAVIAAVKFVFTENLARKFHNVVYIASAGAGVITVSNEVKLVLFLTQSFMDIASLSNQLLAADAVAAYFTIAEIAQKIK